MTELVGYRALLVDDEPDLRILMGELFRAAGCEVDEAAGGFEAIALVDSRPYDFIVSDMRMPQGNGEEIALHVRDLSTAKPLVFIYSGFNDYDSKKAEEVGISELFSKPFNLPRMIEIIASHLRSSRKSAS